MITAGIDAGSRTIKVLFLETPGNKVIASAFTDQGVHQDELARKLFDSLMKDNGIKPSSVAKTVATGYGRNIISFTDTTVTEITCHAVGVAGIISNAATIIDIGGQDSKVIHLDGGRVRDFAMNDRCAAGTGRFLELVAERLGIKISRLGELAHKSKNPAAISSMCVVFAETEMVGLLASGAPPEDIAAGVQKSIAARVAALAAAKAAAPAVFTGGVALVPGMQNALAVQFGMDIILCPDPQMTGALGAAILAARR